MLPNGQISTTGLEQVSASVKAIIYINTNSLRKLENLRISSSLVAKYILDGLRIGASLGTDSNRRISTIISMDW